MALYHTHRPQKFTEVVGQSHVTKTISNQVMANTISHAYLFSGARGIGKTTIARILAMAVNCEKRKENESEPCNDCDSCVDIKNSRAIDIIEIDAASHTGVDNVRENIIDNAQFKPTKSKYKVFIIDEVHMLSTSAFNALLKTLEEPPEHVIFVLATTELHKIPETIISRCQRFNFHKVPYDELAAHLKNISKKEGVKIDKDVVERIINKSDGCVRDAVSLLDQIMATGEKNISTDIAALVLPISNVEDVYDFLEILINKRIGDGLELINRQVQEGVNIKQFFHDLIELLRVMVIAKHNIKMQSIGLDLSKTVLKKIKELSTMIDDSELVKIIDMAIARKNNISSSPLPQLPLELLLLDRAAENQPEENLDKKDDNTDENNKKDSKDANSEKEELSTNNDNPNNSVKNTIEDKELTSNKKSTKTNLDLDKVVKKWKELIIQTESESPSLAIVLKNCTPKAVTDNNIKLSTAFAIYKDKLDSGSFCESVRTKLGKLLDCEICFEVEMDSPEDSLKSNDNNDEIHKLAAAFGGEVV
ncbi:MAG: DNA polymerase III subunit gamma/tau [Candidatus Magasanikbacteria bacterium]|nr:DNA polymerase III subunit gamma/tau [Candidatus Magasanikbacteria bacterium]